MKGLLGAALVLAASLSWCRVASAQWYESEDDIERDIDRDEHLREAASTSDDQEQAATTTESTDENPSEEIDSIMGD